MCLNHLRRLIRALFRARNRIVTLQPYAAFGQIKLKTGFTCCYS